jgi:hypothetical protein
MSGRRRPSSSDPFVRSLSSDDVTASLPAWLCGVGLVLAMSACGAAPDASNDARSTRTPVTKVSVPPGSCPDVSGRSFAVSGMLKVGPFSFDDLRAYAPTTRRKVWISSQRRGHDGARLVVTDPNGRRVVTHRPFGRGFIRGVPQFYPGTIKVPVTGQYRLRVDIGPDTMCVKVRFVA